MLSKTTENDSQIKYERIISLNLKDRSELGFLMNHLKFVTVIEIGVQYGFYADELLSNWPSFKKYYGIDPWLQQKNYIDWANVDNSEQNKRYENSLKLINKFGNEKVELIRNFSNKVAHKFKDFSIDFIYLDARHDYCGVYDDLQLYYPKLKCNGVMAGHDFHPVHICSLLKTVFFY